MLEKIIFRTYPNTAYLILFGMFFGNVYSSIVDDMIKFFFFFVFAEWLVIINQNAEACV